MVDFLNLPLEVRNKIYERVLILPHPFYLFQDPGSSIDTFAPERLREPLALLYTSRQIHREASVILYGMNHFHFVDITRRQVHVLQSFLDSIGPINAALVTSMCLNFPVAEGPDKGLGEIRLRNESDKSLALLQERCAHLSTLEIVVHYNNSGFFKKTDDFLHKALQHIDEQMRAIHSLEKIIVRFEVPGQVPNSLTKDVMRELGWSVVFGAAVA